MTGRGVAVRRGDSSCLATAWSRRTDPQLGAAVHALPAVQRSVISSDTTAASSAGDRGSARDSVSTVKTRLHRARHALQGALVPQGL
jgi:DNA-directed RNA polymerase specialized sigma24 family protein